MNYDDDMERIGEEWPELDELYSLPDGSVLNLGAERFQAPEFLFKPELGGEEMWPEARPKPRGLHVSGLGWR